MEFGPLTILSPKEVAYDNATIAEKAFDCVDFNRRAQVEIYEQIQGMTHEQERAYFEQQAEQGPLASGGNGSRRESSDKP